MASPELNFLGIKDIGIGFIGTALLVFFVAIIILGLVALLIVLWIKAKQYKYRIPLYATVGGKVTRIATFKAREVMMGLGGEKLWFVKKAKKWLPPAILQSAPNEFPHFLRADREWINFDIENLDEKQQRMGVKYIQEDMRFHKVGIEKLLEQRLMQKSFWEKYQHIIMNIVFYLIMVICIVIIFYMWGQIVEKTAELLDSINQYTKQVSDLRRSSGGSLIPADPISAVILVSLGWSKNLLVSLGIKKEKKRTWEL